MECKQAVNVIRDNFAERRSPTDQKSVMMFGFPDDAELTPSWITCD